MDIDSFEPSDEWMDVLQERLDRLREIRATTSKMHYVAMDADEHTSALKDWDRTQLPQSLAIHKRIMDVLHEREAETAYKRSLRHENLLRELDELGYEQWERSGKKAQFDELTEKTLRRGRLAAFHEAEGNTVAWEKQLREIRESLRNYELREMGLNNSAKYKGRSAITDLWAKQAGWTSIEHFKPKHHRADIELWQKDGGHMRLAALVEAKGVHAAITQDEHTINFKPCDKHRRDNHG